MKIFKIIRYVIMIIVAIFILFGMTYYAICYIPNGELILTNDDRTLLLLIFLGIIIFVFCLFYLLNKVNKLEKTISDLYNVVCDIEDNNSVNNMTTQNMIMTLYKKLGDMGIGKK